MHPLSAPEMARPISRGCVSPVLLASTFTLLLPACGAGAEAPPRLVETLTVRGATERETHLFVSRLEVPEQGPPLVLAEVPPAEMPLFRGEGRAEWVFAVVEPAPDLRLPVELRDVARRPDPATGKYRLTFALGRPEGLELATGMAAWVTAIVSRDPLAAAIFIPDAAVVRRGTSGLHVWVVAEEGTLERRAVETMEAAGTDQVAIRSGLRPGERIVTRPTEDLREGMRVRFEE